MLLRWQPFGRNSRPPKTTCFFTDGCATYFAGWWSPTDQTIYVSRPDGANEALSERAVLGVRYWANPANFIASTGVDSWSEPGFRRWLAACAALTVTLGLAPCAATQGHEPGSSITVTAGVGVSVSDETDTYPEVALEGDAPLYLGDASVARVRAALELSGLPGEATDLQGLSLLAPQTFRAAGGHVSAARRLGRSPVAEDGSQQAVYLEVQADAWTRLVTRDARPRERFASAITAGLRIERRNRAGQVDRYLSLRVGRSEVASPTWGWGQVVVEGRARVAGYMGVDLTVGARMDTDIKRSPLGRDRLTVSISVGP